MKVFKTIIFFILLIVVSVFPFLAYIYLIPAELHVVDNLLTVIGLFIAYYTFWATIGIALFIYWLQERNARREEQRRIEQAKSAMLLAVEKAFEYYFFMPEEYQDEHYCDGVKDILSANAVELKKVLSPEEFEHLVKVVNTIDKKDTYEAQRYVRDWLQTLYFSTYQANMLCALQYEDLLDKKTFELINTLKGGKDKYRELSKIYGNDNYILFEKNGNEIIHYCGQKLYLKGVLGYNDIWDEPVILSGFGVSDEYEGDYKDGFYEGKGTQFYEGHHKLKEGIWKKGEFVSGIEYEYVIKVTGGMLTYDSKKAVYNFSTGFKYEKYEQYGTEDVTPLSWSRIQIEGDGIDSYYVADLKVNGDEELVTNIRSLREFLQKRNPELLKMLDRDE